MKKLYIIAGITLAVFSASCNKSEIKNTVNEGESAVNENTLQAGIPESFTGIIADSETKTVFVGETKFSWKVEDEVVIPCYKDADLSLSQWTFYAQEEATSTLFRNNGTEGYNQTGQEMGNVTTSGYTSLKYAVYPNNSTVLPRTLTSSKTLALTLPKEIDYTYASTISDFSYIPLIGSPESDKIYRFYTATSVLKLTVTDVPANIAKIGLKSGDESCPLSGSFTIDADENKLTQTNVISGTGSVYKYVTLPTDRSENADFTLYLPLPVGTLPAGSTIILVDGSDNEYAQRRTAKDVTLTRAELNEFPQFKVTPKVSVSGSPSSPIMTYSNPGGINKILVHLSQSSTNTPTDYNSGFKFTQVGDDKTYQLTNWTGSDAFSATGKYYLHWIALSSDVEPATLTDGLENSNIVAYGSIPFYYTSSGMVNYIVGNYNVASVSVYSTTLDEANKPTSSSFTLAESDDLHKGNFMLTKFDGITATSNIYATYDPTNSGNSAWLTLLNEYTVGTPFAVEGDDKYYLRNYYDTSDLILVYSESGKCTFGASYFGLYVNSSWQTIYNGNSNYYAERIVE